MIWTSYTCNKTLTCYLLYEAWMNVCDISVSQSIKFHSLVLHSEEVIFFGGGGLKHADTWKWLDTACLLQYNENLRSSLAGTDWKFLAQFKWARVLKKLLNILRKSKWAKCMLRLRSDLWACEWQGARQRSTGVWNPQEKQWVLAWVKEALRRRNGNTGLHGNRAPSAK